MKHLKTFEFWENTLTKKLKDVDDVLGVFSDVEHPTEEQLKDEDRIVKDLQEIQTILKVAGIDSKIEILDEDAKLKVGQYHILVFDYEGDKLYSNGWGGDREINVYHYGHTSRCEYEIPLGTEDYTTCVEDAPDKYQTFNSNLYEPDEEESNPYI